MNWAWFRVGNTRVLRAELLRLSERLSVKRYLFNALTGRVNEVVVWKRRIWEIQVAPPSSRNSFWDEFFFSVPRFFSTSDPPSWIEVVIEEEKMSIDYLNGLRMLPVLSLTLIEKDGL